MLGAFGSSYAGGDKWQVSLSCRYQQSDKHFVGSEYQHERDEERSQVVNTIWQPEVSLRYRLGERWSFSVAVPYLVANRSSALRDSVTREVFGRTEVHAHGIGDMTLFARRWMLSPSQHPNTNLSLGWGVKLPTGQTDVRDVRLRVTTGRETEVVEQVVDQSIQPGDGGTGIILDMQWFRRMAKGRVTTYLGTTYLFNPRGTSGVPTGRNRAGEEIMSVADQYVARVGATFTGPRWRGWSVGFGGRLEGVPVHDVFGSSTGFRRPGYAISAEPSFSWSKGPHTVAVATPIAMYRNRTRSVADRKEVGRHGDAAFADWLALASYSFRFGGTGAKAASCAAPPEKMAAR